MKEKIWGHFLTMRLWKINMAICKLLFKKLNKIIQPLWGALAVPNVRKVGSKLNSLKTIKAKVKSLRGKIMFGQNIFALNIKCLLKFFLYFRYFCKHLLYRIERDSFQGRVLQWGPKLRKCIWHTVFKIMVLSLFRLVLALMNHLYKKIRERTSIRPKVSYTIVKTPQKVSWGSNLAGISKSWV